MKKVCRKYNLETKKYVKIHNKEIQNESKQKKKI